MPTLLPSPSRWLQPADNMLCGQCRLHKLQAKHAQRQEVAQRAQRAAAEEVAWDDDAPSPELSTPLALRQPFWLPVLFMWGRKLLCILA